MAESELVWGYDPKVPFVQLFGLLQLVFPPLPVHMYCAWATDAHASTNAATMAERRKEKETTILFCCFIV
jgi:hypothetical protein